MSRPSRIKSFADLAAHLGVPQGAAEPEPIQQRQPVRRPAQRSAQPPARAVPPLYRIGWHPGRGAFYVLAVDDPGYVVRVINLRSSRPELKRVRERHTDIAGRLENATPTAAALVRALYDTYRREAHPEVAVRNYLNRAYPQLAALEERFARGEYIATKEVATLVALENGAEAALAQARLLAEAAPAERAIGEIQAVAAAVPRRVEEHNNAYVRAQLEQHRDFFDSVEDKPLTQRQREAAVVEEDRHLVIAGAGTGKTSTIVARVAHLLRHQRVAPEQILVLAYNETVKGEIGERLARLGISSVAVHTFHGFGMQVITQVEGRRLPVSNLAKHPGPRRDAILRGLNRLRDDPRHRASLIRFLMDERYSAQQEPVYRTLGEYLAATRRPRYLTLDGRFRVKSLAEVRIADWLCRNRVEYEYEARYPHHRSTRTHSYYRPDFFLPAFGVYIEHFGIDRQQRTAPYITRENYLAAMRWKRNLHEAHGTTLVETFQYEVEELGRVLAARLSRAGVRFAPRSDEDVLNLVMEHHAGPFIRLADNFLQSFRENLWTIDRLRTTSSQSVEPGRTAAFLDVFEGVLEEYEATLSAAGEIDFPAMIGLAKDALRTGANPPPFTHVVIDEFQDISHARCDLVRALLEHPGAERKLFAVGDDWQSIYRFTGSDVTIMTHFGQHFGKERRTMLDRTFRFSERLAELSRRFICKNPEQIDKQLSAQPATGTAATVVQASDAEGLRVALNAIRSRTSRGRASVLVLSRYNLSEQDELALRAVWSEYPELAVAPKTIHRAKGAEADFVVVLGLSSAYPEFPSEQTDDPLLRLLVPEAGSYPDAEERRLFYVALTRARRHVYLVAPPETPSRIVTELLSDEFTGLVDTLRGETSAGPCSVCQTGTLIERHQGERRYWTCSNYPGCHRHAQPCRACGRSPLIRRGDELGCADLECGHRERMCPRCGGQLLVRTRDGAPFLACSEWHRDWPGCFFTTPLPPQVEPALNSPCY